jgi:peptide/nickel transport system permease protein
MSQWREALKQLRRYPAAVAGLAIIATLIAISLYTVIAIPYGQALEMWRGGEAWRMHPVNARPVWVDRVTGGNQPSPPSASQAAMWPPKWCPSRGRQVSIPLEFDYRLRQPFRARSICLYDVVRRA